MTAENRNPGPEARRIIMQAAIHRRDRVIVVNGVETRLAVYGVYCVLRDSHGFLMGSGSDASHDD